MRIRMTQTVHDPEHGLDEGREFDVLEKDGKLLYLSGGGAWVRGDVTENFIWRREFEIVEETDETHHTT